VETRTAGSASGLGKRTSSNAGHRAPGRLNPVDHAQRGMTGRCSPSATPRKQAELSDLPGTISPWVKEQLGERPNRRI